MPITTQLLKHWMEAAEIWRTGRNRVYSSVFYCVKAEHPMSPLLATACLCHQGGAEAINQGAGRGACTGVLHIQPGTLC